VSTVPKAKPALLRHRYITIETAALALDLHPRSIRRAIARGELRAYRYNNRVIRVRAEDVEAMLSPIPTASAGGGGDG
jgi:excisionase family DNA binding protein